MITLIPFSKQSTSEWSGGTTTQLFIFPPESSYPERTFSVRISTATIRIPKSDFTSLPGFNRLLMVLEGGLTITHHEAHQVQLSPLEMDTFRGSWTTSSEGLATDFNIIHTPEVKAALMAHTLQAGQTLEVIASTAYTHLYLYQGEGRVSNEEESLLCHRFDSCIITPQESLVFTATTDCVLIESILIL